MTSLKDEPRPDSGIVNGSREPDSISVAVVMPAYNCAEFISQALESVAAQTRPPEQVIVVDDWSRDGTFEAAAKFATEHPDIPVELLHSPQGHIPGPGAVRNAGLAAVRTDWVAFLDADDVWHAEHLSRAATAVGRHPGIVMYYCRAESFDSATGRRLGHLTHGPDNDMAPFDAAELMQQGCAASTPGVVARRDAIESVGGFDERLLTAQDWWLWIRLSKIGRFVYDTRVGFRVRMYPKSHTEGGRGPRPMLTGPAFIVIAGTSHALSRDEKRRLARFWIHFSSVRLQHALRVCDTTVLAMVWRVFAKAGYREQLRWLQVWIVALSCLVRRAYRSLLVRLKVSSPEKQFKQ